LSAATVPQRLQPQDTNPTIDDRERRDSIVRHDSFKDLSRRLGLDALSSSTVPFKHGFLFIAFVLTLTALSCRETLKTDASWVLRAHGNDMSLVTQNFLTFEGKASHSVTYLNSERGWLRTALFRVQHAFYDTLRQLNFGSSSDGEAYFHAALREGSVQLSDATVVVVWYSYRLDRPLSIARGRGVLGQRCDCPRPRQRAGDEASHSLVRIAADRTRARTRAHTHTHAQTLLNSSSSENHALAVISSVAPGQVIKQTLRMLASGRDISIFRQNPENYVREVRFALQSLSLSLSLSLNAKCDPCRLHACCRQHQASRFGWIR
jgi:hypothetical protein